MRDKISIARVALLHPAKRDLFKSCIEQAEAVISPLLNIRVVQGLRTFEEQAALYAIGRTVKGKKVTNSKAGQSLHNYGLAIDFAFVVNGKEISWDTSRDWDNDKVADWLEVVKIFVKNGFVWGGNFKSIVDYPHLQFDYGKNWREFLTMHNRKDFIPGTTYVNL